MPERHTALLQQRRPRYPAVLGFIHASLYSPAEGVRPTSMIIAVPSEDRAFLGGNSIDVVLHVGPERSGWYAHRLLEVSWRPLASHWTAVVFQ